MKRVEPLVPLVATNCLPTLPLFTRESPSTEYLIILWSSSSIVSELGVSVHFGVTLTVTTPAGAGRAATEAGVVGVAPAGTSTFGGGVGADSAAFGGGAGVAG